MITKSNKVKQVGKTWYTSSKKTYVCTTIWQTETVSVAWCQIKGIFKYSR